MMEARSVSEPESVTDNVSATRSAVHPEALTYIACLATARSLV